MAIKLNDRQRALYGELRNRNISLASMYLGALVVLQDEDNPDRFAQSAQSIRELMEKIPRYIAVNTPVQQRKISDELRELEKKWDHTVSESCCCNNFTWEGSIDLILQKFLHASQAFFKFYKEAVPSRREGIKYLLRKLDVSGRILPISLENANITNFAFIIITCF